MSLVDLVSRNINIHIHIHCQQTAPKPRANPSIACLGYHLSLLYRIRQASVATSTSHPHCARKKQIHLLHFQRSHLLRTPQPVLSSDTLSTSSFPSQHYHVFIPSSACSRDCYQPPRHPHLVDSMRKREQHPASHRAASPLPERGRVQRHRASTLLPQRLGRRGLGAS